MKLETLIPHLRRNNNLSGVRVQGVADDTRQVQGGEAFFVIGRKEFDVFSGLPALASKVSVFVASKADKARIEALRVTVPVVYVDDVYAQLKQSADIFYRWQPRDFTVIGVTGTKGKTTTATLLCEALNALGKKCGLIGTIECRAGKIRLPSNNTTPGYHMLRKLFRCMKQAGCRYVVMEVSSHGIHQGRIQGIPFSVCVFTNLSREHLDYHKTMRAYFGVKKKFFIDNARAQAIINADDRYGRLLARACPRIYTYAVRAAADVRAENVVSSRQGSCFDYIQQGTRVSMRTHLLGRHNVYNVLAAAGALASMGVSQRDISRCMRRFRGVEGRMQRVGRDVFVDYAHTHDSLKKTLETVRQLGYRYVIVVFGCGGNRDHGKRRLMGSVACKLADYSIITMDNPRTESPAVIAAGIAKGFSRNSYCVIEDRAAAIRQALARQQKHADACVVVAGKGHEGYQIIGKDSKPFKDAVVIRSLLRTRKKIEKNEN